MSKDPTICDKIWIEIVPPEDRSEASRKLAQERCDKANVALGLLGIDSEFTVNPEYFESDHWRRGHWSDHCYHITRKTTGEFSVLSNNGHWFNLDFISKTGFWEQKKAS